MRPRLKPLLPVIRHADNRLQIGDEPRLAVELTNESGGLLELLELMDGTRTVPEILRDANAQAELVSAPALTEADLADILAALDELRVLDDASADIPLRPDQIRYTGNYHYFSAFSNLETPSTAFQRKLSHASIVVLGMGGLGSNLLLQAAGLGFGLIRMVDGDTVELKNLNRQTLYDGRSIGRRKTEAGLARLEALNPSIAYECIDRVIAGPQDLEDIVSDGIDLVYCAMDSPPYEIQSWVDEICVRRGIPYVAGGCGMTQGQYYSVLPGVTHCKRCFFRQALGMYGAALAAAAAAPVNPAIAPHIAMVASLMMSEGLRICLGYAEPVSAGRRTLIDYIQSDIVREEPWAASMDCTHCSALARKEVTR
jgi:molybdopterin-synthase adenylyltransferase